jgi:uncharacterized membrane protein
MQQRWISITEQLCFALNCMLLFLALFGEELRIPVVLQVLGRAHPMLVHFPIVLLILAALWQWKAPKTAAADYLLLSAALTSSITALAGLFLRNEQNELTDTLYWHKWSGVVLTVFVGLWYYFRQYILSKPAILFPLTLLSLLGISFTGHYGANLTHGDGYLLAPLQTDNLVTENLGPDATVYQQLVQPILRGKCLSCHNEQKQKGGLSMETEASMLKGGKHGKLWDNTIPENSLLLIRAHLPIDAKEHMPPKGKPQLTNDELEILRIWIKSGASFSQKAADLAETDSLRQYLKAPVLAEESYDFPPADAQVLANLRNDYREVQTLSATSPAVAVSYYGTAAFDAKSLADLRKISAQMVSLNLNRMPVTDADVRQIAEFQALRKLNVSFTKITGASLGELSKLKQLKQLLLSGTQITAADLSALQTASALRELYLFNTNIAASDIPALRQKLPQLHIIETGFQADTVVAKLNAPLLEVDNQVFTDFTKVKPKNFVKGAEIRYTLDGSMPDSIKSPVCTDSITIEKTCVLTTKAFLKGWQSSEASSLYFYKVGVLPDSLSLVHPPNAQYKGLGAKTLADKIISDTEFTSGKWLGYRETDLVAYLFFKQPTELSSVTLSGLVNIPSYIMPPATIEVWAGADKDHLKLIKKLQPQQPKNVEGEIVKRGYQLEFAKQQVKLIKLVVKPVAKLPAWHPGKGDKAWVFLDEVFLE